MKTILLILVLMFFAIAQNTATVSSTSQQTVKGFGCCPIWIDNYDISTQPLTQQAAYGMGATVIRHSELAGTGDGNGNVNTTGADKLCRAIQITADAGLPYILSNWSPPADMKTIAVNGSVSNSTKVYLRTDKEQIFCDFVVKLLQYINTTKGLPLPVGYSLQNEPTCETQWAGCIYGADQYKRVAKLLRTTLNNAGLSSVMLLGPEDGGYYNGEGWNWSTGLLGGTGFPSLNDAAFNSAIGAFASHSYNWSPGTTLTNFNKWIAGCDTWNKDKWQTEFCYIEESGSPHAVGTVRRFISDMAFLKNNYWFTWIVNDANDVPDALCYGNGTTTLTKKPTYFVLKKLYSSIPIGSKVRRMTTNDNELVTVGGDKMDMVAFASDTNMVVVIVNPTATSKATHVNGLSVGTTAKVYQMAGTTNNTDMSLLSTLTISNKTVSNVTLPVNSITVIVTTGVQTQTEKAGAGVLSESKGEITVFNIRGQRVVSKMQPHGESLNLDLQGLKNGVYFVVQKNGKKSTTVRYAKIR